MSSNAWKRTACDCTIECGDDENPEGPGTCKGLPRAPLAPLVEVVLVPRSYGQASR